MKEVYCSSSLSPRQNDLYRQIIEAVEFKDFERFSTLEFKWVHRYGLESVRKFIESIKSFDEGNART